jgi:hypothetical protein
MRMCTTRALFCPLLRGAAVKHGEEPVRRFHWLRVALFSYSWRSEVLCFMDLETKYGLCEI